MERDKDQTISDSNPMGTDGFEFVEFAVKDTRPLGELFESLGFVKTAYHRSKNIALYGQGAINFLVNGESNSFASQFFEKHGESACSFAIRVADAEYAYQRALKLGARPGPSDGDLEALGIPAIMGIGGSLLYFVDRYKNHESIYDTAFHPIITEKKVESGHSIHELDHLTHNVYRGNMDKWAGFYEKLFNFKEIRYFDIEGKLTGLKSRAMTSPCGKIRIPINESSDDKSQIEEYLTEYQGEGIQHIALASGNIYETVTAMKTGGVTFMTPPPEAYYDMLEDRIPWHNEDVEQMKSLGVLMDGAPTKNGGLLLQIFTETVVGPIFFEVIQRKGDEGFGEGNFKALFESMERDQIRRGVLKEG
ncbi:4-hydroxyphenylpyruvate dioxygenase [Endozoicomonas sp. Mp262]|uniref:4-hydroxyphenylpyruvate dioxygenase n=1 Tax=Endozoicomonas sp. Mp262 TaxID=2919499 RepID=UPI0021D9DD88